MADFPAFRRCKTRFLLIVQLLQLVIGNLNILGQFFQAQGNILDRDLLGIPEILKMLPVISFYFRIRVGLGWRSQGDLGVGQITFLVFQPLE